MFSALYLQKTFQLKCPFSHEIRALYIYTTVLSVSALCEITIEQKVLQYKFKMCHHKRVTLRPLSLMHYWANIKCKARTTNANTNIKITSLIKHQ